MRRDEMTSYTFSFSPQDIIKGSVGGDFTYHRVLRVLYEINPSTGAIKGEVELFLPHVFLVTLLVIVTVALVFHFFCKTKAHGRVPNFSP